MILRRVFRTIYLYMYIYPFVKRGKRIGYSAIFFDRGLR